MSERITHNLQVLSERIAEWQKETFPTTTIQSAVEHLRRESNEIHEHYFEQVRYDEDDNNFVERETPLGTVEERGEEFADLFFLLVQSATKENIDLGEYVMSKLTKNRARTWKAPDALGVVEHVVEPIDEKTCSHCLGTGSADTMRGPKSCHVCMGTGLVDVNRDKS